MIYDSLDKIPFKLFYNILENGDFSLLDTEPKQTLDEDLKNLKHLELVWSDLHTEHLKRKGESGNNKIFHIIKRIYILNQKQRLILLCIDSLRTSYNEIALNILRDFKFIISDDTNDSYHNDLNLIEMMANEISDTIEELSKGLPSLEEQESQDTLLEINKLLASYSLIVGYRIDPNTATYNEVEGVEKSIESKIKATKLEKNG